MKTTLSIAFLFLLIFFVMILVVINCEPRVPVQEAIGLAMQWTLHLFGGVVAVTAAIGMLIVAATHGSFQRQIVLTLPLLAGLLVLSANWGLALALAVVTGVWVYKFGAPEIERGAATSKAP